MLDESYLVPKLEGQQLSLAVWSPIVPDAWKWEFWEGIRMFRNPSERDQVTVCLVFSMGLEYFYGLLPQESKKILKTLVLTEEGGGLSHIDL